MTAIAKMESLELSLASFFAASKYGHAKHFFGYTQLDVYESGLIVLLPASLLEKASTVGLSRLTALYGSDHV